MAQQIARRVVVTAVAVRAHAVSVRSERAHAITVNVLQRHAVSVRSPRQFVAAAAVEKLEVAA
jgi:hypothetical protein